jgi:RHS repeat-associated protein
MPLKSNVKCVATKSSNGSSDTTYLFTDALGSPVASMGTIAATVSYSCPAGWALSGNTCTQSSSSSFPASVTGYTCPSGYTLSGSTCTRTTTSTSAATVTYSCPAGYAVSGSSCTGSSSYAASGSLSCNGYGSLQAYANSSSGYKCITQNIFTADYPDGPKAQCQAIAASMGLPLVGSPIVNNGKIMQCVMGPKTVYACPSGGTLSGSTCTTTSSTAATANYSCPAGQSLSGSTCTASSTSSTPGAPVYSCPSGATLSGSNCTSTGSSTTAATAGFSCPSGGTLSGSNCTGAVSRTRYEAYGGTAGGVAPNTLGFTGHVNDAGTGLVYMQQRYYDPVAGRFLSTDPVVTNASVGSSFNRFNYANNNPLRYTDPDGREVCGVTTCERYIAQTIQSASANAATVASVPSVPSDTGESWSNIDGELVAGGPLQELMEGGGRGPKLPSAQQPFNIATSRQNLAEDRAAAVATEVAAKRTVPPNMSPEGAGRSGAFNEAKRQAGVPTSQQPSSVLPNMDRRNNIQPDRIYQYEVPAAGGITRTIRIRDDAGGHNYGVGNPQTRGPHFNDPAKNHYDY